MAMRRYLGIMLHWLPGMWLLIAPVPSPAQDVGKRVALTDRQKFNALRDAKRLCEKAEISERQGKADEAEHMAEQALALEEQVRGLWHIQVALRLDQVADLYTAHKKERAAELLYDRAKAIRERALSTHPDVYERDGGELRPKKIQPAEKAVPVKP